MKFFKKQKRVDLGSLNHDQTVGGSLFFDWTVVLVVFTILVLIVVSFDGYLLFRINRGDFFEVDSENQTSQEVFNRKALLNATEFFDLRQKEYEAMQTASSTIQIDPSI